MIYCHDGAMQRVALAVYEHNSAFDLAVVNEVWRPDRTARGVPRFELRTCADGPEAIELGGGLTVTPERGLDWFENADLIVVPGFDGPLGPFAPPLLDALRAARRAATPVAALCRGAFVLAEAGQLAGRRAVTHWAHTGELARMCPDTQVEPGALFVEDNGVWTSAGTAAGIDLCLHLVRRAHGAEVAAAIARSMVTAPFRTGGQAQFIAGPTPIMDQEAHVLGAVREQALRQLDRPLPVAQLAEWAGMSERTFARRFRAAAGVSPAQWLLEQRIAAAQKLLERTDLSIETVAGRSGFGSPVMMRQHFAKQLGVSPRDYRRAFHGVRNERPSPSKHSTAPADSTSASSAPGSPDPQRTFASADFPRRAT
jgi:transcriptional regulator GlxA family with amidase domain